MQPNTPNQTAQQGATHHQAPQVVMSEDDQKAEALLKLAKHYVSLLFDPKNMLGRNSKSDAQLLHTITKFAKELYSQNLKIIQVEKGYDDYSAIIPIYFSKLGNISLNYCSKTSELRIFAQAGKRQLPFLVFSSSFIWDEELFVNRFIYGNEAPKPDQSQNPVFNFFDLLLQDFLTE